MSVETELTALAGFITSAYDKVSEKGGTVPQNKNMQNLTNAIDSISGGHIIIPPSAGTLTSISVTSNPTKTVYNEGENFDFTGLVVTALYSSGNQYDVTSSCTYTMNQPLQYGDSSILVTYETQTTTISITVNALPIPAPASTTSLYHFDNNLNNECGGSATGGSPTYTQGKFGNAVYCSNAFTMNQTPISNNDLRLQNHTFEFWAKCTATATYANVIYSNKYYQSSTYEYAIFNDEDVSTNGLRLKTGSLFLADTCVVDNVPSNFDKTQWNHIAVVFYDDGTYKCFLNGVLASHGNTSTDTQTVFGGISSYSNISQKDCIIDEYLFCNSAKYTGNFIPNNAPYYIE